MNHPTPLAWSYVVLLGGVAIVMIALAIAVRSRRHGFPPDSGFSDHENPRITSVEEQYMRGEITREECERRRAEIMIEDYERHRSA